MKALLLLVLLVPVSHALAQEYSDTPPSLAVSIDNDTPYLYRDPDGRSVVSGMVSNSDPLSAVTNVVLQVNFYDDTGGPPEVVEGGTSFDVVPAGGVSPYVIRSSENPDITHATISLLGFDGAPSKGKDLEVSVVETLRGDSLDFEGVVQNGGAPASDVRVYLAFYDSFDPPRILDVVAIGIDSMGPGESQAISLAGHPVNPQAVGFYLLAESDVFHSNIVDAGLSLPELHTRLVTISNISIEDAAGNPLPELSRGQTVNIGSSAWIQLGADQPSNETPYTYYVQVKSSGEKPYVEFVGEYHGRFLGTGIETPVIDWVPENEGLYFVETFLWDRNHVPLASPGPSALILVR